jgi:hypothetical protein
MIITDRFVCVHEPKTGGSFVTSALLRVHGVRWTRWTQLMSTVRRTITWHTPYGAFRYHNNKHGTCNEAPVAFRDRPFLSTIRHPLDLYVSEYEFGWWKRPEMLPLYRQVPGFAERFPTFPDIAFAEYVDLAASAFRMEPVRDGHLSAVGPMTERFIRYYCTSPAAVLAALREAPGDADVVRRNLHDVHFLRTKGLNAQLHRYLLDVGYPAESLAFIPAMERVLPLGKGRSHAQPWESYYSPSLRADVRRREALLFELIPAFEQ